ncbi:MAG TPA: PQQ-dependent sugar dehydrogenase [Gammaproteobacteria bacterium]|nr:PQQ-dependent sugar dehydrogenase [Gammaproteobacteria bacterium]
MRAIIRCVAAAALGLAAVAATGQQQQQQRGPAAAAQQPPQRAAAGGGGAARSPNGIVVPPLGDGPFTYKTAEQEIRVVVHTRGLTRPWSLVWLPGGEMLVTERPGRLRIVRNGVLDPEPIAGLPEVRAQGLSGLFDVALHPQFATNRFVYLSYNKGIAERQNGLGVARGVFDGKALTNVRDVFVTTDASSVSRLAFGRDGKLYVSLFGNAGDGSGAQNPMSHAGKVVRLNDDGTVPADNPFVGREGYKPEIYTLGHRSTEGLIVHPMTGELWESEQGPNGGDEINILKPGANYGWPLVSTGRSYPGPWQSKGFSREGFEDPIVYWMPSIATSGLAIYTGDKLPGWKNNAFVGGMRMGEIPGTGHLERIRFNDNWEELRREMLLVDLRQRIRDVRQGPDELLYLLTDEDAGAILRIEPAN